MKNFVQPGDTLTLTAPYAVSSGACALIGSIFGVAANDIDNGASGVFAVSGVFELVKATPQAWSEGDRIYWDDSAKKCTTTKTANTLIGAASEAAASGAATGRVKLNEAVDELGAGGAPGAAIADLGGTLTGTNDGSLADVAHVATSGGNTYSDAAVNAALDAVNGNAKELQAKVNAILAALRSAGIIASS